MKMSLVNSSLVMDVEHVRLLLTCMSVKQEETGRLFNTLEQLRAYLVLHEPFLAVQLSTLLHLFLLVTQSTTARRRQALRLEHIWMIEHSLARQRLLFLLQLFCYFKNRNYTVFLELIWFLLHYRGLSLTGFHLLHQYGVAPATSSLGRVVQRAQDRANAQNYGPSVWWCDNLRRHLKGLFPHEGRIDWTVTGRTLIEKLPNFEERMPALGDIFEENNLNHVRTLIASGLDIDFCSLQTSYAQAEGFSVPLRGMKSSHFQFLEGDVLPVACGSLEGTLQLLKFIQRNALREEFYGACVLDYDLYWRSFKFFFSSSCRGSFPHLRERLILIMGPWHIYKLMCEAVWKAYAPIIFAPMWLAVLKRKVPDNPSLVEKLTIFISVALCTKNRTHWNPVGNEVASSICALLYRFIPLVRFTLPLSFGV